MVDDGRRQRRRPRFAQAFWRTGRALLGPDQLPGHWSELPADPALAGRVVEAARADHALATYAEHVAKGEDPVTAQVATVRALLAARETHMARSFSAGIGATLGDDRVRRLGLALVLTDLRRHAYAWHHLRGLEPEFLARHAPVEAVHCALVEGGDEARASALAVASHHDLLPTEVLPAIAGRLLVAGLADAARDVAKEAEHRADAAGTSPPAALANLRRWLEPEDRPVPAGRIVLGVLDHHQPDLDRSSHHLGDHVQTLAALGNLARFAGVRFHGADGLGELVTDLQQRVRPALRIDGPEPPVDVELRPVSRDYSEGDRLPADTWLVAFGRHLHPVFDLRHGLPYHPAVHPIFVSFHLDAGGALTPAAVEHLRAHGPVGCRDWSTVGLLLSAGVDAFFTGCLTSTVDAVFPDRDPAADAERVVAYVDPPRRTGRTNRPAEVVTHADPAVRGTDLVPGLRAADRMLHDCVHRFHRVVTTRLHSYLPATALGVPVRFVPRNPSDVRLDGLAGLTPHSPALAEMQDGIRDLLAETLGLVLAGASPEQVRDRWRELTAPRVAAARRRLLAPHRPFTVGLDGARLAREVRSARHAYGPHHRVDPATVTDVALSLDQNVRAQLPVTIESLVANASGPVRLWVTSRGLDEDYRRWLSAAFPSVPLTFLSFDGVEYGVVRRLVKHITVATMDRLLLPEVLPDLARVTYLDVDTVTLGDVGALARTDLAGKPLAARTTFHRAARVWRRAGDLVDPGAAADLRRWMAARHPFDVTTFNAGVLVLDLDRLRADRFVERFAPLAAQYGLNDQDILLAYAGADRVELDPAWNALPVHEPVDGARIVHYAGAGKPWQDRLVPSGELWLGYRERFLARTAGLSPMP